MGDRGEAGFEGAWRQVHTTFEHQVEETPEQAGITGHHIIEGHNVVGAAEVQTEHAARLSGHERNAGGIGALLQAIEQAAGLTTLRLISRPGFHAELSDYTSRLLDGLQQRADAAGIPFVTTQAGGMFGLYFSGADDIVTFDDVMASDANLFKRFFHLMLEGGVYLAPSAFEAGFTSIAHGDAELQLTLDAAERAFAALK